MAAREARAAKALATGFLERYPGEAARALEQLEDREIGEVLLGAPPRAAAPVWMRLGPDRVEGALLELDDATAVRVLDQIDPLRAAEVIARFPPERREACLVRMDAARAREVTRVLAWPEDSAARLMDPRVLNLRPAMTVEQALKHIRDRKPRFTRHLFLVDDDNRLQALVAMQDLALAERNATLQTIARPLLAQVAFNATREEIIDILETQKLTDLPVADIDGRFVGVIHYEALVGAMQEDAVADLQTMVGVSPQERALSSIGFSVRKRLPWLEINLLTAFLAAAVVGIFESTIAQFTALAVLLPVVAGQSGNAGAQALAVTMRGLALREISVDDGWRVARKEVAAGFLNGTAIAVTTALGVLVWSGSTGLALVIAISMVLAMVVAGLSGALIPVALIATGQDPAQSSSIILTTVTDVVGFFSFLGIATLLAHLLV